MNEAELDKIVTAWIAAEQAENESPEYEANCWAVYDVLEWAIDGEGDKLWPFILKVYKHDLPVELMAVLAAGALEGLLATRGAEYIDRVEELARKDPKFSQLLGGVWRSSITDDVWERVKAVRNAEW